jgi:hypothetical protein
MGPQRSTMARMRDRALSARTSSAERVARSSKVSVVEVSHTNANANKITSVFDLTTTGT